VLVDLGADRERKEQMGQASMLKLTLRIEFGGANTFLETAERAAFFFSDILMKHHDFEKSQSVSNTLFCQCGMECVWIRTPGEPRYAIFVICCAWCAVHGDMS
jgi:hypothetical protein